MCLTSWIVSEPSTVISINLPAFLISLNTFTVILYEPDNLKISNNSSRLLILFSKDNILEDEFIPFKELK